MSRNDQRPPKESILDLNRYMDVRIFVELSGQRKVEGVLKGFDQLSNLVLDDARENISDEVCFTGGRYRSLGRVVIKGTQIVLISPVDDLQEIQNPFN